MAEYKLRYLSLFYNDLKQAVSHISDYLENPSAARRLLDDVEKAIQ